MITLWSESVSIDSVTLDRLGETLPKADTLKGDVLFLNRELVLGGNVIQIAELVCFVTSSSFQGN